MAKRDIIRKQGKIDYLYKCDACHISAHEPEPTVAACPICHKRMQLISWPSLIDKPLRLSELGKLSTLKALLSKPDSPDIEA